MQEIIVVSDNHGEIQHVLSVQKKYPTAYYIHCGDSQLRKEETPGFIQVRGNNDPCMELPDQVVVEIEGLKIMVCHGHHKYFPLEKNLAMEAKQLGCSLVCYGHTHVPYLGEYEGVKVVNPGSTSPFHNRDGSLPSYAYLSVEDGKVKEMEIRRFSD